MGWLGFKKPYPLSPGLGCKNGVEFSHETESLDLCLLTQIHLAYVDHGLGAPTSMEQIIHLLCLESTVHSPPIIRNHLAW